MRFAALRLSLPWVLVFMVWAAAAPWAGQTRAEDPVKPAVIDKPLVARWSFDEPSGDVCRDASGNRLDASLAGGRMERTVGLFGGAIQLSKSHVLHVPGGPKFGTMPKISLSAWAAPVDLSGYREIFRKEDGENRVLFSFQGDGKILSLGLNVGGYLECDARINPAMVLDGGWHHCAATFDGQWMRVYLDGQEVGSLKRPGTITAGGGAPGCIGSSGGGECFQGALDELVIYGDALTPQEVASLHSTGAEKIERRIKGLQKNITAVYAQGASFAETLASCRKKLLENKIDLDRALAAALIRRLRAAFPNDCRDFDRWTSGGTMGYLTARDNGFNLRESQRLVGMMMEYRPLTEHQKRMQTPEQARKWEKADAAAGKFDSLKAQGDSATFSPDWVNVILAAGPQIQLRPYEREAVAPYRTPETPPTQDLTAEEAREALRRDWLHQAGGRVAPERLKSEIQWTRELAGRITSGHPGRVDFAVELAALEKLAKQAESLSGPCEELYYQVRAVKRAIMFRNPVVDFDKVLYVDMPFPQGSEWPHQTRHRLGYQAVPGARLLVLEGLSPAGKLRQLMPQPPLHGSFWRPDVSYDAKKVLFCFKPHNEKAFHLYEINADGTGLVQLTDGRFDDFDPIYLPDGEHIIFSTTRGHTYVRCMPPTNAFVLARCERDGKNIYLISYNNEPDYVPSVMNDGRIIYTRWEYTDKPLWRAQALWTVNPDGTQVQAFWGNQSVWPDLLKDARSIPGSGRIMFTGSAHHNWFSGSVGIIDPDKGFNFPNGLTKVTGDLGWPESGNGPVDPVESPRYHPSGAYGAYYSPYPLSEHDFLVSANRGGKFVLYLMDVDGNRELIYEGVNNIFHALPLAPRERPPVIADRVAWPDRNQRLDPQGGVIYSNNVYQGAPEELRDKARYLRVLNIEHKTYTYWNKRPYLSTGPVVSAVQSEGVKRILGTVPIEADGSVAFHAPSSIPLHFQLLDENYRALQTMRSFTGVMPGERRGCLGCHESHSRAPAQFTATSIAAGSEPRPITPPPWGDESVSFPRFVQPVLDRYCVKCHGGAGKVNEPPDLTDRPGFLIFSEPYVILTGRPSWGSPYVKPKDPPPGWGIANMLMVEGYDQRDPEAYQTPKPMTHLSYKSPLVELASSGKHHEVKVDPVSLQRLIAWIDTMCPYRGDEEVRAIPDPDFQGIDWLSIRPKIQTAPRIVRPGPVD